MRGHAQPPATGAAPAAPMRACRRVRSSATAWSVVAASLIEKPVQQVGATLAVQRVGLNAVLVGGGQGAGRVGAQLRRGRVGAGGRQRGKGRISGQTWSGLLASEAERGGVGRGGWRWAGRLQLAAQHALAVLQVAAHQV